MRRTRFGNPLGSAGQGASAVGLGLSLATRSRWSASGESMKARACCSVNGSE